MPENSDPGRRKNSSTRCLLVVALLIGCSSSAPKGPLPGPQTGLTRRAIETQVYDGTHAELWQATLTLFQDLGILPTFTDRDSGIIKAEVPYSDKKVGRKIAATVLLGVLAMPLWMDSGEGNRIFTAWVRELDESHVSVRLLGVSSKGDKLWSDKDYPVLHNTLRDTVQQQRFLKGTQTPLE